MTEMGIPFHCSGLSLRKLRSPIKKGGNQQMAYLSATIESLVKKELKKAMKGKKCKRNRAYDSSSSDSDSE
jgi:hypothetical protein